MKRISVLSFVLLASMACSRTTSNSSDQVNRPTGTSTSTSTATDPNASATDLTGTWVATEGARTWELVIQRTDANTWTTTPTMLTNSEKGGLIDYGPPGSKGDTLILVSDGPGKFRIRYAEAKNFHDDKFWPIAGTYDGDSFKVGDYYSAKRKK